MTWLITISVLAGSQIRILQNKVLENPDDPMKENLFLITENSSKDVVSYWQTRWIEGQSQWHSNEPHFSLVKYLEKLKVEQLFTQPWRSLTMILGFDRMDEKTWRYLCRFAAKAATCFSCINKASMWLDSKGWLGWWKVSSPRMRWNATKKLSQKLMASNTRWGDLVVSWFLRFS